MSDDAPQFKKIFLFHALCWIHRLRAIEDMMPSSKTEASEIDKILDDAWTFYKKLKAFQEEYNNNKQIDSAKQTQLKKEFDEIFAQPFKSLRLCSILKAFREDKESLLYGLEYPDVPLHNNGSENVIRAAVIKRKISGPTRSDEGRRARDIGLTIVKTCRKLGISPWKYINDSLRDQPTMQPLSKIIAEKVRQASHSPPSQNNHANQAHA